MGDVLVIGVGPAGLLAAWIAARRGARVRLLATGIGTTPVSPGWVRVLGTRDSGSGAPGHSLPTALVAFIAAHPNHPYALAGLDALQGGAAALREVGKAAGLSYVGELDSNLLLPTALGATIQAALVPESFAAGDLRTPGALLIAGPAGWRDFYPKLCADNLARAGYPARGVTFDLPEMAAASRFDATPPGLARLFDRVEVRQRVAAQLRPQLDGATRVGLPAVIGLERHAEAWQDLRERLGVPVFEIPTLPPSVPGMRLFNAFKANLLKLGVPILLDMTATCGVVNEDPKGLRRPLGSGGVVNEDPKGLWRPLGSGGVVDEDPKGLSRPLGSGVIVPDVVRDRTYRADTIILATGGLYGGGIVSDHTGALREAIFDLPLYAPGGLGEWFDPQFLADRGHPIHQAGVRVNRQMQPVDETGRVVLENVRIAGRLLAHCDPLTEGSAEGVWLASAYRAACSA